MRRSEILKFVQIWTTRSYRARRKLSSVTYFSTCSRNPDCTCRNHRCKLTYVERPSRCALETNQLTASPRHPARPARDALHELLGLSCSSCSSYLARAVRRSVYSSVGGHSDLRGRTAPSCSREPVRAAGNDLPFKVIRHAKLATLGIS